MTRAPSGVYPLGGKPIPLGGLDRHPTFPYSLLMTNTLHAHVSTSSRDCDGGHGYDYVLGMTEEEINETTQEYNDFHEINFRQRVISGLMSVSGFGGTLTTHSDEDGAGYIIRASWSEQTDEGFSSAEAVFCEDEDCDPNASGQFDQYAEMMGY